MMVGKNLVREDIGVKLKQRVEEFLRPSDTGERQHRHAVEFGRRHRTKENVEDWKATRPCPRRYAIRNMSAPGNDNGIGSGETFVHTFA
jgi:hypothetical protein